MLHERDRRVIILQISTEHENFNAPDLKRIMEGEF